jgi:hypothetical protein
VNKVPGSPLPINVDVPQPGRKSEVSDDEPLYDSVASDEDYIAAEQMAILSQQAAHMKLQESKSNTLQVSAVVAVAKYCFILLHNR